jgi:hypothetical protein
MDQALGGVGRFRFLPLLAETSEGGQRHRHRSSELFPALWRHLPGQEHAEVRRAFAAMLRTGLSERCQPMMRIEAPKQDRLQHTEHPRRQVGAPHAARAVIVLAAHHRVA